MPGGAVKALRKKEKDGVKTGWLMYFLARFFNKISPGFGPNSGYTGAVFF
jgi:hypothetical protein